MSISVHHEPADMKVFSAEHCCFCRASTRFWAFNADDDTIAVCPGCGERAHPDDLPTKKEWMRRERIATDRAED